MRSKNRKGEEQWLKKTIKHVGMRFQNIKLQNVQNVVHCIHIEKNGFSIFCAMYRFCPACGRKMTNAEAEQGERELKKMQETWWKKVMYAWKEGEK